jgi:uncharacterized protein (TIGR03083 family)
MDRERYLELLGAAGARLRETAARDLSAAVPSCPGWTVLDVVRHTAEVYEHKIACVALGGARPDPWPPEWPPAARSLAWFEDAHRRVLEMLRTTDPAAPSWTWWPEDQTAGFWLRRMALETAVHLVDVELALGAATPLDEELAVDGIDELLCLMLAGDWTGDEQPDLTGTVAVATQGRAWTIRMLEDRVDVESAAEGDVPATVPATVPASVAGDPSSLLLWLYGRAPEDAVAVSGDLAGATRLRARLALATQ